MQRVQVGNDIVEFPDETNEGEMLGALRRQFMKTPSVENTVGRLEALGSVASAALAEPISGILSLPALAIEGGGVDAAVRAQEAIQEALTYVPRTEQGMRDLQDVANLLEPVAQAFEMTSKGAGDYVMEKTGNPELAAAAYTAPTAFLELLGVGAARKAAKAGGFETQGIPSQRFGQAGETGRVTREDPTIARLEAEGKVAQRSPDNEIPDGKYIETNVPEPVRRQIVADEKTTPQQELAGERRESDKGYQQIDEIVGEMPVIDPEVLKGRTVKVTLADLTGAGRAFEGTEGVETIPIELQGGPEFPRLKSYLENNIVWAAQDEGAISRLQDGDVVLVSAMMPDSHASNATVATSFLSMLGKFAEEGRISPENLEKFKQKGAAPARADD